MGERHHRAHLHPSGGQRRADYPACHHGGGTVCPDGGRGGEHHHPAGHSHRAGRADHRRRGRHRGPAGDGRRPLQHGCQPGRADQQPAADGGQLLPFCEQWGEQLHHLPVRKRGRDRLRPGDIHRNGSVRGSGDLRRHSHQRRQHHHGDHLRGHHPPGRTDGRIPDGQRVLPGRLYRIHVRHDGFGEFHGGHRHCQQQRGGGGDLHHQRRPDGIRRRLHGGVHQYAGLHHRGHGIHQWGAGHNLRCAAEDGEAVRCGEIPGRV